MVKEEHNILRSQICAVTRQNSFFEIAAASNVFQKTPLVLRQAVTYSIVCPLEEPFGECIQIPFLDN